jgi:hypothetical protein
VPIEATTKTATVISNAISAVSAACNFRRRAVWRYTKTAASSIDSIGSRNVENTSIPGVAIGSRDENTDRMIAMAQLVPIMAAISEETSTSFSRICSERFSAFIFAKI